MDDEGGHWSAAAQPGAVTSATLGGVELKSEESRRGARWAERFDLAAFDEVCRSLFQSAFARSFYEHAFNASLFRLVRFERQILKKARAVPEQLEGEGEWLEGLAQGFRRGSRLESLPPFAVALRGEHRLQQADEKLGQR